MSFISISSGLLHNKTFYKKNALNSHEGQLKVKNLFNTHKRK